MVKNYQQHIAGLPAFFERDDLTWLQSMLAPLDQIERSHVCAAYSKVFRTAFGAEPNEVRKPGKARFEANTRLRLYMEKRGKK